MSEETWRPFGVVTDEDIAEYDALHDGVPNWMWDAVWVWIREAVTVHRRYSDGSGSVPMLDTVLAEQMCQTLRISLPNLRKSGIGVADGKWQLSNAIKALLETSEPLAVVDYLLAHAPRAKSEQLQAILDRSKSAWTVGARAERPGLVRRVPSGVQSAADSVMARAGRAGVRLTRAWEALYGLQPDASAAYGLAIKAIEDAAIPVVSPTNEKATLGTVLAQMEQQANWRLPMDREDDRAASGAAVIAMMRLVWVGQHDRHGGQPSAPGDVSLEEATVAVSFAVTLVNLFAAALPARAPDRASLDC